MNLVFQKHTHIYMHYMYPELRAAVSVRESEQGRFRRSIKGAWRSTAGAKGSTKGAEGSRKGAQGRSKVSGFPY